MSWLWAIRFRHVLIASLLLALSLSVARNVYIQLRAFVKDVAATRSELNAEIPRRDRRGLARQLAAVISPMVWLDRYVLTPERAARSPRAWEYQILSLFHELGQLPREETKRTLVFVPKSLDRFYGDSMMRPSLGAVAGGCMVAPFLVPSITGMALLHGYPREACELKYYSYEYYRPSANAWRSDLSDAEICHDANDRGFLYVIVVEAGQSGVFARTVRCTESRVGP
jgi:hypothetical protein